MKTNKELVKLKKLIDEHILNYDAQIEKLNKDISKVASHDKKIEELPEWIYNAKKEITTFTFQLISTIIGFLSLTLAIVFLWINKAEIDIFAEYILVVLGIVFTVCFLIFVYSFIKKNFSKIK